MFGMTLCHIPASLDYFAESQINSQICVVALHHFEELEVTWKMDFFLVSDKIRNRIFLKGGDKHGLRARVV